MRFLPGLILYLCLAAFAARAQQGGAAAISGPVAIYEARGVLKAYNADTHQATISHDAIPGYMQAMTMDFNARSPDEFASLVPGDIVSFHLSVTAHTAWVDHVVKTGVSEAPLLEPPSPGPVRELVPGDAAPDAGFIDQSGKPVRISSFKGDAVAITFIYTGCPLPTYCPLMDQNFAETQDLMTRLGAGDHWQLLTISMDPAHDTPKVLAAFAAGWHADPAHWKFATGEESRIKNFGAAFGLEFQRQGPQIYHNLRTVILDPAGRIYSIYSGNSWTPQQLASDLRAAMHHPVLAATAP